MRRSSNCGSRIDHDDRPRLCMRDLQFVIRAVRRLCRHAVIVAGEHANRARAERASMLLQIGFVLCHLFCCRGPSQSSPMRRSSGPACLRLVRPEAGLSRSADASSDTIKNFLFMQFSFDQTQRFMPRRFYGCTTIRPIELLDCCDRYKKSHMSGLRSPQDAVTIVAYCGIHGTCAT
jgi:hypothetical protein